MRTTASGACEPFRSGRPAIGARCGRPDDEKSGRFFTDSDIFPIFTPLYRHRYPNMKPGRLIALFFLFVYFVTTGASSYAALTCRCAEERMAAVPHPCCPCCLSAADLAEESCLTGTCCCDHDHSNEVTLYTLPDDASERSLRCCVVLLPHSMAVECPCPGHVEALRRRPPPPPLPLREAPFIAHAGLRAPPATV